MIVKGFSQNIAIVPINLAVSEETLRPLGDLLDFNVDVPLN